MNEAEAIAALHRDMPRQGPGLPGDVRWALDIAGTPEIARIADAGCGPGADLLTLADARPEAKIEGIEMMPHLAEEARAATAGLPNVSVRQGDMAALTGPYDLIWCAGALYFLGIAQGLSGWRAALAPGGCVAFSEPVLEAGASETARAFWQDYSEARDLDGIAEEARRAGFELLGHRRVVGDAWRGYYDALSARIAKLRPGARGALADLLERSAREIRLWQAAPDEIAYALLVVRPVAA